jgi:acyl carrier protein
MDGLAIETELARVFNHEFAIEAELRRLFTRELDADLSALAADESLREALGVDSLRVLELVAVAEWHFDVSLDDRWLGRPLTLRRLVAAIAAAKEERRP